MDRQLNLFSFSVGVLALVSTVVSVAMFLRGYLPSAQMKHLDELFDETHSIFEKAISDGLLPNETFRVIIGERLTRVDNAREVLRTAACHATSSFDEFKALLRGLSKAIMVLVAELKQLRRCVVTTSQMERTRRLHQSQPSLSPSLLPADGVSYALLFENLHATSTLISADDTEASYSTTNNLLPPAPNIDFSALLRHSPHQSINCSLCLLGTNRPSGERDVADGDQLPTIIEPCNPSPVANKTVHWFIFYWRSITELWTRKVLRRDLSLDLHLRNIERNQPFSTPDEATSGTLTVTDRHQQTLAFGPWGSLRGILPKSYSTPDLRSEMGHNESFLGRWIFQSNRSQDGLPHRHFDSLSPPV